MIARHSLHADVEATLGQPDGAGLTLLYTNIPYGGQERQDFFEGRLLC